MRSSDQKQVPGDARELSRQELYDLVWSEPARTLAPRLGLSDVGLAKVCKRHGIPKPGIGYWEKVRHGKRVRRPGLPAAGADEGGSIHLPTARAPQVDESEVVAAQRVFEASPLNQIVVRDTLRGAHPLVVATREALSGQRRHRSESWGDPRLRPGKAGCLDLHVSSDAVHRALRLYDALIKASEARGFAVSTKTDPRERPTSTFIAVRGEKVRVRVEESCRQEERPGVSDWRPVVKVLVPTGRLVLRIDEYLDAVRKSWADGTRQRVESCLNGFMVSLVEVADGIRSRREEWEERERRRREQDEERRAQERLRAAEEAKGRKLRSQALAWSEARLVREFVAAVEAEGKGPDGQEGERLSSWCRWALQNAEGLDPLSASGSGPPDLGGHGGWRSATSEGES